MITPVNLSWYVSFNSETRSSLRFNASQKCMLSYISYTSINSQTHTKRKKKKRTHSYIPIKSVGIFPLQNLPVGLCVTKSLPYGKKSHLMIVCCTLLFPGSMIESPNVISAGASCLVILFVLLWPCFRARATSCWMTHRRMENAREAVKSFIAYSAI